MLRTGVPIAVAGAWLAATPVAAQAPTIQIEFVVENASGAAVTDLQAREILVQQEGVAQEIASMKAGSGPGRYVVTYVPKSGKPGPVMVRLYRPGAVARGPDGPAMKITVFRPPTSLEAPLLSVLDAADLPRELAPDVFALRFENHPDGVHHAFVIDVPLAKVEAIDEGEITRSRLGLMAHVETLDGREVRRFSIDYPIDTPRNERDRLLHDRIVWTSHMHVPPGRYVLEAVARDTTSGRAGAVRIPLDVDPPSPDLRMSSISVLQATDVRSKIQNDIDNPLEHEGRQLVPALRPQYIAGSEQRLRFFVVLYPPPAAADPLSLTLELFKDGQLLARGPVKLPASAPGRPVPYMGSFALQKYAPGAYEVRLKVTQGTAVAEAVAPFDLGVMRVGGN